MQPLVKAIKIAHLEDKDWKRSTYKCLLKYRAISHATTGKSPAELLFSFIFMFRCIYIRSIFNHVSSLFQISYTLALILYKFRFDFKYLEISFKIKEGAIQISKIPSGIASFP